LNFVQAQPNITWIAAMGFSAGGSTVLRGAVERPEVRAVIAEGQYANLGEEIIQKVDPLRFSVWWQVKHITALILWAQLGISPWEVSPRDALPKLAPRPVLLIFGENEADRAQASDQFESAQKPKEMWLVPGAGHGDYLHHDPVAYEKRVLDFLERSRSANP
jgi:pimeloyl-ACP methyl ester carboxylesterase